MDVVKDCQRNQDVTFQEMRDSAPVVTRCPIRTKVQTRGGVLGYVLALDLGAECHAQQVTHV
jgi:hypothetical protein